MCIESLWHPDDALRFLFYSTETFLSLRCELWRIRTLRMNQLPAALDANATSPKGHTDPPVQFDIFPLRLTRIQNLLRELA